VHKVVFKVFPNRWLSAQGSAGALTMFPDP